jgi:uncharacterized membrane protein YccC
VPGSVTAGAVEHLQPGRVAALLARPSPALRYGIKLGTAVVASIWIAEASNLSWGLTIWITVMLVAQPNAGASIQKGLLRTAGSIAAALASIVIYGLFAQQPPLYLASIVGVIAVAAYGMLGTRDQYAWMVFGLTTIIILVKAMVGSDRIETLAFERATLTALGVLIVFVADTIFWPIRAEEQLREGLAERSQQLGDTLKRSLDSFFSGREPGHKGQPPSSPLISQLGLADQARDEIGANPSQLQTLTRIALLLEGLASRARLLERAVEMEESSPAAPLQAALERLGRGLEAALGEGSHALTGGPAPARFAGELYHSLARFEDLIRDEAERRGGADREPGHTAALSALAPVLRDAVAVLGLLEEALVGLASDDGGSKSDQATKPAPVPLKDWFRLDPIRVELALRAGIAAGGVIVLMIAMGWHSEEDLLPFIFAPIVAFIFAGMLSTRGAGTIVGIGWALGVLLGWLIADLASVFLFTHLLRMPLALVYPFVIALGAGYLIVRGSPLGVFGAIFGMIAAILPVFISAGPPQDVDTGYGLSCGVLLGLATGRVAQLVLWPRTAMQTFLDRAAGQLDLCLQALSGTEPSTGGAAPGRDAASLVGAYAKQLTLMGKLHAMAHTEPVERALDDTRRAELLALTQDLFDASLRGQAWGVGNESAVPQNAAATLAPLHEALTHQDEALVASLNAAPRALRETGPEPDASLGEARAAVEAQIDALRGHADLARALDARRKGEFLVQLAASRRLVDSQLRVEAWLADWRRAAAAAPGQRASKER